VAILAHLLLGLDQLVTDFVFGHASGMEGVADGFE